MRLRQDGCGPSADHGVYPTMYFQRRRPASTLRARCRFLTSSEKRRENVFERAKCAPDSEYQKLFRDLAVQWLALAVEADASEPPELPSDDQGIAASKSGGSAARIRSATRAPS
jgi:hypothetical protein